MVPPMSRHLHTATTRHSITHYTCTIRHRASIYQRFLESYGTLSNDSGFLATEKAVRAFRMGEELRDSE